MDCGVVCASDWLVASAADSETPFVEEETGAVVETCVCVKDSPMMVKVYTSDGKGAKEKTSKGEAHSQSS